MRKKHVDVPWRELHDCAVMSKLAYKEPGELDACTEVIELGLVSHRFFDGREAGEDAQAYMWERADGRLYLCFRGTESRSDVLADIDVRRTRITCGVRVHTGFHRQFASLIGQIEAELAARPTPPHAVVCCGHSLGGALATIAAAHLAASLPEGVRCYTFGCPRVGNRRFARLFGRLVPDHWRVNNDEDPVPMIPMSLRFVHTPRHVDFNDAGEHRTRHGDRWFLMRMLLLFRKIDIFDIAGDHNCDTYIARTAGLRPAVGHECKNGLGK